MENFEKASRLKLRFTTDKGGVSVEDLWDIPLTSQIGLSLDNIAKSLNKQVKENQEESFVIKKSSANDRLELMFEIVKHVIKKKLEDIEKAENKAANSAKKQKILEILEEKEDSSLKKKSKTELKKMLDEL
jgi:hypothetical protein